MNAVCCNTMVLPTIAHLDEDEKEIKGMGGKSRETRMDFRGYEGLS